MQPRTTFWGVLVIFFGAIIGAVATNSDFYERVIIFCAILILISYFWTYLSTRKVTITRRARGLRQQFGSVFEEQYEIKNLLPFSKIWLEVEDGAGLPGGRATRVLSNLKKRSSRSFSTYTLLSRRGEYILGPTKVKSGDPFGLFVTETSIIGDKKLLVLPYLVSLADFPFPVGLLPGGSAIRRKTPEVQPPRVSSVREYTPSDSLNRIHWPTTARKDRLMVKEFEQDPLADVWIFLDAQSSVHIRAEMHSFQFSAKGPLWWLQQVHGEVVSLPDDTFEYATCIAGSIARYLSRRDQVVGFAAGGQTRLILSAEKGERQLSKVLETLALLKCEGKLPFPAFVNSLSTQIPKGSTIILVTPTTNEKLMDTISQLFQRGMKPVVVLLNPYSFSGLTMPDLLISRLTYWKVPYTVVGKGDDIKEKLEKGFSYKEAAYL
jgi:uncharacterized protein (DUF58 family)